MSDFALTILPESADRTDPSIGLTCGLCETTLDIGSETTLPDALEAALVHSLQCAGNIFLQAARVAETAIVTSLVLPQHSTMVTAPISAAITALLDEADRENHERATRLANAPEIADDVCNACGAYVAGGADPAVMSQHDCEGEEG